MEGDNCVCPRSSVISVPNSGSNSSVNNLNVTSPQQERFGKEITKVQELMLQNEAVYESEIEELTNKLIKLKEENQSFDERITELESQESVLSEIEDLEKENNRLSELQSTQCIKNKERLMVIEEYQRSISKFKSQYDAEEQLLAEQKSTLSTERDLAEQHVNIMEADFNSVHQKYEKCKSVIEQFKENERALNEFSQKTSEKLGLTNLRYQNLKDHASQQIEKSHHEIDAIMKRNRTELAKALAILKKMDLKCETQEETINQMGTDQKEMIKLCDVLIGQHNDV